MTCLFCKKSGHKIYQCLSFNALNQQETINFVKHNRLCFNCLGSQHTVNDCRSQGCCIICKERHHTLLHFEGSNSNQENSRHMARKTPLSYGGRNMSMLNKLPPCSSVGSNSNSQNNAGQESYIPNNSPTPIITHPENNTFHCASLSKTTLSTQVKSNEVLLATAMVKLFTIENKPIYARVILDSCSTTSLVTKDLVRRLGIRTKCSDMELNCVQGTAIYSGAVASLQIHSAIKKNCSFRVSCCVLDKITKQIPSFKLNRETIPIFDNVKLADPDFYIPSNIDILLGADVYYGIVFGTPARIPENSLYLINTHFGHIISGPISSQVWWGADPKSLLMVYNGLIKSHLDFASIFIKPCNRTFLRKLDTVQMQAIRMALGCMRSTPTNALLAEAAEFDLENRRKTLATQFIGKILTINNHPLTNIIQQLKSRCAKNANFWKNNDSPYLVQAYNYFLPHINKLHRTAHYPIFDIKMDFLITPIKTVELGLKKKRRLSKSKFQIFYRSIPKLIYLRLHGRVKKEIKGRVRNTYTKN
ncbi:hypothetical protein HUJ05_001924 [Dendroctonus ponderosae]|nr:hypothetical protein HUJ05_001924 [Dendroctonus ponderosae]